VTRTRAAVIVKQLQPLAVPIDTVSVDPDNARRGDVGAVLKSLATFGQRKPIVASRETGVVIAGNHTLMAARQLGWPTIAVVFVDDNASTAKAYALADNRTGELASWDGEQLSANLAELLAAPDFTDMDSLGWTGDDLDRLLRRVEFMAGQGDPDAVPDVPAAVVSRQGDIWLLGPHRLMCGNSLDPAAVDDVLAGQRPGIIYTDPPYGISIVKGNGKIGSGGKFRGKTGSGKVVPATGYLQVAGDGTTDTARDAFTLLFGSYPESAHVWWGGNHYAASAGLPDSSCWLIWDKDNGTNNFADAELAWTSHPGAVRILHHMWNGMLRATERGKRVHPTQKPVALAEWAFAVVDPGNDRRLVLDVFGGSGSTLIAAHETQRAAALVEMEPAYVDVICRRYQEHTGDQPILASTGEPHDFTGEPA
jgi:DNA methylase/ParB-like nuclease family protein